MLLKNSRFALFSDKEWVEHLLAFPCEEDAHRYFFNVKCNSFLKYISQTLFGGSSVDYILGEFYEFLSNNDWAVLRMYKQRNDASLSSYLSRCTINHFMARKRGEDKKHFLLMDSFDIVAELDRFTSDEEVENPPVWQAYSHLSLRDRTVLRLLVIEGKHSIDVADEIWPMVKSTNREWRELPVKRVQDTIAIIKRRALLALQIELKRLVE